MKKTCTGCHHGSNIDFGRLSKDTSASLPKAGEKSTVVSDKSTEIEQVSYVFGYDAGESMKKN